MAELPPWSVVAWVARIVLGLAFLASAFGKLRDLSAFVLGALDYDVLPAHLVRPLASVLPVVELVVAVALLTGVLPAQAAAASLLLLTAFAGAVAVNLRRGRHIPCFCGGARSREVIGLATLARILLLGVAAVVVAVHGEGASPWPEGETAALNIIWPLSAVVSLCVLMALLAPIEIVGRETWAVLRSRRLTHRSAMVTRGAIGDSPSRARTGR